MRQLHIVAVVVGEPVHLPAAEQALARRHDLVILDRQVARRLFQHDLAHVGRIDRHPTVAAGEELGAAVLCLRDVRRAGAEALVAVLGRRHAHAIDVARRHVDRARQPDIERVKIGALAAEVAALEQRLHVTDATAARLRIAEGVVDDPLIERARLVDVGLRALGDVEGHLAHDAVGRNQLGRRGEKLAIGGGQVDRLVGPGEIRRTIARHEAAGDFDRRVHHLVAPLGVEHRDAVLAVVHHLGRGRVAGPAVVERLLPAAVHLERQRYPGAGHAEGVLHLDPGHGLERAPALLGKGGAPAEGLGDGGGGGGLEEDASIHGIAPGDGRQRRSATG